MLHAEPPAVFPGYAVARHLCRLCLCSREQTARQRLNHVDWFKWPGAPVTRLYESVVGEQLPVASELSELHCDACLAWLEGTQRRIEEFKRVNGMWTEHLERKTDGVVAVAEDDIIVEAPSSFVKTNEADSESDNDAVAEEVLLEEDAAPEESEDIAPTSIDVHTEEYITGEDLQPDDELQSITNDNTTTQILAFEISQLHADYGSEEHLNDIAYTSDNADSDFSSVAAVVANSPPTSLICDMCAARLADKTELLQHFNAVHGFMHMDPDADHQTGSPAAAAAPDDTRPRLFACTLCPRRYMFAHLLRQHREYVHPQSVPKATSGDPLSMDRMLRCRYCRLAFTADAATDTEASLHRRRREHYRTECAVLDARRQRPRPAGRSPLRCDRCTAAYLRPVTLRKHYETSHTPEEWHVAERRMCVRCFRQFADAAEAAEHQRTVHERWRCQLCGKLCMCAESLQRHVSGHSARARKHRCDECDGTYVTANQLKTHKRRKHTMERPFECDWPGCAKRYTERGELNVHRRAAHGSEKHVCSWCMGTFNSLKYLSTHVAKEHTGDFRYYGCPTCGSQFANTRLMNAHRAVHHADEVVVVPVE